MSLGALREMTLDEVARESTKEESTKDSRTGVHQASMAMDT